MVVSPVSRISFRGSLASADAESTPNPLASARNCFFAGPENALLPSLVKQTVNSLLRKSLFTPFILWGGRGTGKSLLANGLGEQCRAEGQEVVFIDGKKASYASLKKQWSIAKSDALWIIDNLDLIAAGESVVEFFCHLVDRAVEQNRRVVVTTSIPPNELAHFPARLRSRLNGGLVLKLNPLSIESKTYVLRELAEYLNIHIEKNAECLLNNYVVGMDEPVLDLAGRIYAAGEMDKVTSIDFEMMGRLLNHQPNPLKPQLVDICRVTAKYFGISIRDLKGRSRQRGIVFARHVFMYLAHDVFEHSLQKVGVFLCRDHSTVLHGCQVLQKKMAVEREIEKHVLLLKTKLKKELVINGLG